MRHNICIFPLFSHLTGKINKQNTSNTVFSFCNYGKSPLQQCVPNVPRQILAGWHLLNFSLARDIRAPQSTPIAALSARQGKGRMWCDGVEAEGRRPGGLDSNVPGSPASGCFTVFLLSCKMRAVRKIYLTAQWQGPELLPESCLEQNPKYKKWWRSFSYNIIGFALARAKAWRILVMQSELTLNASKTCLRNISSIPKDPVKELQRQARLGHWLSDFQNGFWA